MTFSFVINASYFIAAVLFIFGLKRMSSPVTARAGIIWAGVGMLIATLATFLTPGMENYLLIVLAIAASSGIAWYSGKKVAMTDMPQMIALYNGMGGGAAAAIAAVELIKGVEHTAAAQALAVLGALIGAIAFSGSLIAFAKLQGILTRLYKFPHQQLVNLSVFALTALLGLILATSTGSHGLILLLFLAWHCYLA